jgi:uncharacterized protein YxjI
VLNARAMHELLQRNQLFFRAVDGAARALQEYDVLDPLDGTRVGESREIALARGAKAFRSIGWQRASPFELALRASAERGGDVLLRARRGTAFLASHVVVTDAEGRTLGSFQQKVFQLTGRLDVLDARGQPACVVQGKWKPFEFRFFSPEHDFAVLTKQWAGPGRELFAGDGDCMLRIKDTVAPDDPVRALVVAAVMVLDLVLRE